MNMVKKKWNELNTELTPEELLELEEAELKGIVFDEDCPEMTASMLQKFNHTNASQPKIQPEKYQNMPNNTGQTGLYSLEEVFEGYRGNYIPDEVDWGDPVGKEIW